MHKEIKDIMKDNSWEQETLPNWQKKIGIKMIYKPQNNAKRYKHRLLAIDYKQRLNIDHDRKQAHLHKCAHRKKKRSTKEVCQIEKVSHRHLRQANRGRSIIQGKKFT